VSECVYARAQTGGRVFVHVGGRAMYGMHRTVRRASPIDIIVSELW
jgi:hypothetical protein